MEYLLFLKTFLGWCTAMDLALLAISSLLVIAMRSRLTAIQSRMFGLSEEDLSRAYFQYLAQFKIAVIVFNLTPYLALKLML